MYKPSRPDLKIYTATPEQRADQVSQKMRKSKMVIQLLGVVGLALAWAVWAGCQIVIATADTFEKDPALFNRLAEKEQK